jgi:hypothetical protein
MFERSLERGHVGVGAAVEIELFHRADPGSLAEPPAQRGIVEKELCRGNESLWVSRRNKRAGLLIVHQLAETSDVRRHDGNAEGHRLFHRGGETFRARL